MAERIPPLLASDEDLDLIGGAAGAILGLLALHAACGSRARPGRGGPMRRAPARARRALGSGPGLAHPAGEPSGRWPASPTAWRGSRLALTRLGAVTGDARFLDAGLAGFAGETGKFWPRLRPLAPRGSRRREAAAREHGRRWPGATAPPAWASPGSAPSPTPAATEERAPCAQEMEDAVATTLQRGPGQNHCLCHGDLGNLDFLLQARERSPEPRTRRRRPTLPGAVLASLDRDGWLCGTRGSIESPGLMNGFAGIGLGLLRLAEPGQVPSVLGLDTGIRR